MAIYDDDKDNVIILSLLLLLINVFRLKLWNLTVVPVPILSRGSSVKAYCVQVGELSFSSPMLIVNVISAVLTGEP